MSLRKLVACGVIQGPGRGGPRGNNFRARISDDQVREIRALYNAGEKLDWIASKFCTSKANVSMIGTGARRGRVA